MFGESQDKIEQLLDILSKPAGRKQGYPIKHVLEIGCGDGSFVESLREDGFIAQGIDLCPRKRSRYIHRADARDLYAYFKRKRFDAIVACGVLCSGGQLEALSIENPILAKRLEKKKDKQWEAEFGKFCRESTLRILRSCYRQLRNPGVFINVERNTPYDTLSYTREDAVAIGYRLFLFRRDAAILTKEY